jgi:hypothetical protein
VTPVATVNSSDYPISWMALIKPNEVFGSYGEKDEEEEEEEEEEIK